MSELIKQYSVTNDKYENSVAILDYTLDGRQLLTLTFNEGCDFKFMSVVAYHLPHQALWLTKNKAFATCKIKDISKIDTSFEFFWKAYGYKVGGRSKVEKKWKRLTYQDKVLALGYIRRYKRWCDRKRIDYCYPMTYLNQRRWEDLIE